MALKSFLVAALAAVSYASPILEARQSNSTGNSSSSGNVTEFINNEYPIALSAAIANIGGTNDSDVGDGPIAGVVVASPSIINPDYFYTWTRDSALTMLMLADELYFGTNSTGNNSLQTILEDYVASQAFQQTVYNPVGTFYPAGSGLGEAKFYTNLTRYDGTWGRPQNDGPALRATTFMEIATNIVARNPEALQIIGQVYWPIILNDLKYVGQYWNTSGYDLWEEVHGSSFFTATAQHRALVQGQIWADMLNETCDACSEAPAILCFLQNNFWNETGSYIIANINSNQVTTRTQIGVDPILAAMHNFDINATCDALSIQPCNEYILATHKTVVDSFRNLYPINDNATAPAAVAVGRYPEDTYYNGNPWYITTLACAEVLYDAVAQIQAAGSYAVTNVSLAFFQDIYPDANETTYGGDALTAITDAMTQYADGFVEVVQKYTPSNGTLNEQYNATTGEPTSAQRLTWSYAAFVTMAERRNGSYPPSWGANSTQAQNISQTCPSYSSYNSTFTYVQGTAAGAPVPQPYSINSTQCLTEIIFAVNCSTTFGDNVYIIGNSSLFGNSLNIATGNATNTSAIISPLLTGNITAASPTWYLNEWFPAGSTVEYKYVIQNGSTATTPQFYTFENISRLATAPACGAGVLAIDENSSFPPSS